MAEEPTTPRDMVALRGLIDERFDSMEALLRAEMHRVDQELAGFIRLTDERWAADRRAVDKAENAAQIAIEAAKAEANERLKEHNGLIEKMKDESEKAEQAMSKLIGTFATKDDISHLETTIGIRFQAIDEKLGLQKETEDRRLGGESGVTLTLGKVISAITVAVVVLGVIIALANYLTN